jgi:hypothetical protein
MIDQCSGVPINAVSESVLSVTVWVCLLFLDEDSSLGTCGVIGVRDCTMTVKEVDRCIEIVDSKQQALNRDVRFPIVGKRNLLFSRTLE